MKTKITITTVLILIAILIGCSSNSVKASGSGNSSTCVYVDKDQPYICQVHLIKIRGHEYILSYTTSSYGGTCIIHAASCSCHPTE